MCGNFIAVVGAVNVDIWGRSLAPLIARDSNPGEIRLSPGGVGRNIAHNMRLLDIPVQMLTALGGDAWAEHIEKDCLRLGIGLDRALRLPDARTSTYICISGPDGDLALGLSDTDIADYITPAVIEKNLDLLSEARLVVFDGNLTQEAMDCLTEKCPAPLFVDPVSVTKAKKLLPFLSRIHTIKPNCFEAEALTGETEPDAGAQALIGAGVKRVFVSDGPRGMVAAQGTELARVPCLEARLVNATGGGDAVMAGLCKTFLLGCDLVTSAEYALAAGAIAVECGETINPALSDKAVRQRLHTLGKDSSFLYK